MNVIEVNNLSKRFLLGSGSLKNMLLDRREADRQREFWALKDVSFALQRGTSLGIVGHNGSGKSTMLKLLTGILEPTKGSITTRGRIGALIEVGAGFHPDLTGRENVYLNGSILGMSEREITKRFDEIVDFAGLEQFIDTPVKRYSSGMYMRLGFSIAANINPDILIVDEVLAVGDTLFQNKCMKRMKEFLAQGGTVVFVSHAMTQVEKLCEQCVWLDHGRLLFHGDTQEVVSRYMSLVADREDEEFKRKHPKEWLVMQEEQRQAEEEAKRRAQEMETDEGLSAQRCWSSADTMPGNEIVRLRSVRVRSEDGRSLAVADIRRPLGLEMEYEVIEGGHLLVPNFHLRTDEDERIAFVAAEHDSHWHRTPRTPGRYVSTAWIPGNFLSEGIHRVEAVVSTMEPVRIHLDVPDAIAFQVVDAFDGTTARGDFRGVMPGVVRPLLRWNTRHDDEDHAKDAPLSERRVPA